MLNLDNKNPNNNTTNTNTYSRTLIALKPRPVLLAQRNRTTTMTVSTLNEENCSKITSLTPELKSTLHEIILFYLHRNGFSKTLKRFQSEAQIQSDAWKDSSLHLEDIFCKYNACNTKSNKNTSKKPVLGNDEAIEKNEVCPTNEETTTKKKKKRGIDESDNGAIKAQSEVIDKKIVDELETKPKKKKKTKNDLNFSGQAEEAKTDVLNKPVDDTINGLKIDDSTRTTKDKKKRSVEEEKLETSTTNENEVAQKERKKKKKKSSADSDVKDEVNKVKTDTENETISRKEKMSSKKRKRSLSDEKEHENVSTEMTVAEESKRQKTEISKEEKSEKEEITAPETCNQQLNGQTTGKTEINGGEKSGVQKSTKKQRNATAEPKTVNAFQRVKMDQVEFAHEKLQDNSYWAKDGADIGYGAKAQEVLGQVRGRDFRHEKTKKKRGSYRGGLIDLQSHSIKFDYSDED